MVEPVVNSPASQARFISLGLRVYLKTYSFLALRQNGQGEGARGGGGSHERIECHRLWYSSRGYWSSSSRKIPSPLRDCSYGQNILWAAGGGGEGFLRGHGVDLHREQRVVLGSQVGGSWLECVA